MGGRKQRELLSLLILHRNRAVSPSRLAADLWGDEPPRGAEVTLRSHVSHLRRRLSDLDSGDVLDHRPGWLLPGTRAGTGGCRPVRAARSASGRRLSD